MVQVLDDRAAIAQDEEELALRLEEKVGILEGRMKPPEDATSVPCSTSSAQPTLLAWRTVRLEFV